MRRTLALILVASITGPLPALGQVMALKGTTSGTFTLGLGNDKLTLTNTSGTLSLDAGLTVTSGTVSFSVADIDGGTIDGVSIGGSTASTGAFTTISASGQITSTVTTGTSPWVIASTTKVANLNVDQVDGMGLVAGSNGAVGYQSSTSQLSFSGVGTSGQLFLSGGSGSPTWTGLDSGKILVGDGSNIPAAISMGGDGTLSNSGVLTIGNNAVTAVKLNSAAVTASKLADAVADEILTASLSAGSEVSDVITCTLQVKEAQANNLSGVFLVHWNIADGDFGAGETSQSVTVSYTNGSEWNQITQHKKAVAFTDNTGKLELDVTHTGANTMYLMCVVGGKVYSVTLTFS